jgi:hypothetical protein
MRRTSAYPMAGSLGPTNFVLRVELQLFAVSRLPVAQVGFPEYMSRLQRPTQFGFVGTSGRTEPEGMLPAL